MTSRADGNSILVSGPSVLRTALTRAGAIAFALTFVALLASELRADTWQAWPDPDGGLVIKKQSQALQGWSGILPDGRAYRIITEPTRNRHEAEIEFTDGTRTWVPRGEVCPDAPWLIRHSAACR